MQECTVLFCPIDGPPHDIGLPVDNNGLLGPAADTYVQVLMGAPVYDLHMVSLWQSYGKRKAWLSVACRDWHGLEAGLLKNGTAAHIQVRLVRNDRYQQTN